MASNIRECARAAYQCHASLPPSSLGCQISRTFGKVLTFQQRLKVLELYCDWSKVSNIQEKLYNRIMP